MIWKKIVPSLKCGLMKLYTEMYPNKHPNFIQPDRN